jgi:hypothetical protein
VALSFGAPFAILSTFAILVGLIHFWTKYFSIEVSSELGSFIGAWLAGIKRGFLGGGAGCAIRHGAMVKVRSVWHFSAAGTLATRISLIFLARCEFDT